VRHRTLPVSASNAATIPLTRSGARFFVARRFALVSAVVNPDRDIVPLERGIHVHVNGAGGHGHDETSGVFTGFFRPISGTTPQFADDDNWCVTRIDLIGRARPMSRSCRSAPTIHRR